MPPCFVMLIRFASFLIRLGWRWRGGSVSFLELSWLVFVFVLFFSGVSGLGGGVWSVFVGFYAGAVCWVEAVVQG